MASFGLLISNYSDNIRQAMFVIWFFSMIFMLMSGIFLKGSTLADLWFDLVCLLGIGSVTTTWAILSYKKTS